MNFMVRPSKSFLFDVLEKELKTITCGIGLDAASAHFKNRRMFKTDQYYGLDIDLKALKKAMALDKTSNTFALYADLTKLSSLPENSFDAVVSTNTLDHLTTEDKFEAVENLSRITYGKLLLELKFDQSFIPIIGLLKKYFNIVNTLYYKNFFSRAYEKIFEKDGFLGNHPIAGLKFFRLLSWLISRLEYLTCRQSSGNHAVFIVCQEKKDVLAKKSLDLSGLSLIQDKIYQLL